MMRAKSRSSDAVTDPSPPSQEAILRMLKEPSHPILRLLKSLPSAERKSYHATPIEEEPNSLATQHAARLPEEEENVALAISHQGAVRIAMKHPATSLPHRPSEEPEMRPVGPILKNLKSSAHCLPHPHETQQLRVPKIVKSHPNEPMEKDGHVGDHRKTASLKELPGAFPPSAEAMAEGEQDYLPRDTRKRGDERNNLILYSIRIPIKETRKVNPPGMCLPKAIQHICSWI